MTSPAARALPELTSTQRNLVLAAAFLGWMFGGVQMAVTSLAMRSAAIELLGTRDERLILQWFAWYTCAFLFGAALGGLLFGWLGDRWGRSRGLALSILCYSYFCGLGAVAPDPWTLMMLRFVSCLGVGGVWPNGVALASEAWPNTSRPALAGILGTAANLGLMLMSAVAMLHPISPESWRWVLVVASFPALLGIAVWCWVPESPRWLAARLRRNSDDKARPAAARGESTFLSVFHPPLLSTTLVGIALGTVPVLGGWGSVNWIMPWADQVGQALGQDELKAHAQMARSSGGAIGSFLGGWIASLVGRRLSYCLISLASLVVSQYLFHSLRPGDPTFLLWTFLLGLVATTYFGWLPLFLPELFPTAVRSAGAGVSFNSGRTLAAVGVLLTGSLQQFFAGDYARVGQFTSLVFLVGAVVVWAAPDTSRRQLMDDEPRSD
jgi:MFS transporter, SHS family, sialic acid transporter